MRTTWVEYKEQQVAFTVASVTVNTAIAMFRHFNEEFISNFPHFGEHGNIMNCLFTKYRDPNGKDTSAPLGYKTDHYELQTKTFFVIAHMNFPASS